MARAGAACALPAECLIAHLFTLVVSRAWQASRVLVAHRAGRRCGLGGDAPFAAVAGGKFPSNND
jgi:hypothetical protein